MPRITNFEVVQITDEERPVILIYALADGALYELSNGRWISLPITDDVLTLAEVQAQQREAQAQAQVQAQEPAQAKQSERRSRSIKNNGRV